MWSVERDPRAPLGRRGAQQGGLVVVFGASSVVAVESPRVTSGVPDGEERYATGVYDLTCSPMGVPRVWSFERDHELPLCLSR